MRTAKTLVRMCGSKCSPDPSLISFAISTINMCWHISVLSPLCTNGLFHLHARGQRCHCVLVHKIVHLAVKKGNIFGHYFTSENIHREILLLINPAVYLLNKICVG